MHSSCCTAIGSVSAHFSPGILPILMAGVNCDGSESRLVNCSYLYSTDDCTHSNDVGVHSHCARNQVSSTSLSVVILDLKVI